MQFSLNIVNVVLEKSLNLIFTSGQEPWRRGKELERTEDTVGDG